MQALKVKIWMTEAEYHGGDWSLANIHIRGPLFLFYPPLPFWFALSSPKRVPIRTRALKTALV